jgi:serine/threonine protein kinase
MAPELIDRQDYQGPRVDVWSLGVGLACMLAGWLPS